MSRFEADIPVTDLDDPEDDFIVTRGDADSGIFSTDNYDIDNDSLNLNDLDEPSIAERIRTTLSSFLRPNNKGFEYFGDSIEMRDRSRSLSSFASSEDYLTYPNDGLQIGGYKRKFTKTQFNFLLIGFVTFLVGCAVLLTKNKAKFDSSESSPSQGADLKTRYSNGTDIFYPTTILISLDGFHPHYISKQTTPFLHDLLLEGYGSPYMIPSFPSSTFPNHWTLATGLYPSEHGIVGNSFFDPDSGKQFINTNPELSLLEQWWGGDPIWQTAALQGVSSAIHMWPGSEVPVASGEPLEVDKYNGSEVLSVKVDRLLSWLDRDTDTRPELLMSYVPTIDSLGHKYGVSGNQLEEGLRYVDNFLDSIYMGLILRNLTEIVNFVVVSDHGMSPTSNDRLIYLDDLVDMKKIEHMDGWPLFGLRPFKQYSVEEVYNEIQGNRQNGSHFTVYKREDLPKEWHFGYIENQYTSRIAPIWVVPEVGYTVTTHAEMKRKGFDYHPLGIHGYNNTEVLMRALFLGDGPFFEKKLGSAPKKLKPFQNTEIYSIICESLDLIPAPNNGSARTARGGLVDSYVSSANLLEKDWQDAYDYPNVSFEHDMTMLRTEATYDLIWRKHMSDLEGGDLPVDPTSSLLKSESSYSTFITPESVPDPSYYSSISSESSTAASTAASTPSPSTEEGDAVNGGESNKDDDDNEDEDDEDDNDDDEDDDDKDDEDDEKDGFLGFLEDVFDDLEDTVDDIVNDIVDSVQDTYNDAVNGKHGKDD
ncbi:unnamed protein product [Kuraishia capsulata CBS 1993]|uniref:Uncharacterized protein n=1 Tax=Kuraishia capsulata CBS 1993 TaxID=1382522 RepID=W6MGS5_9ASCO|nr:uncharacterized protein KUCA_T00001018001 [Kuraishia capsulata CBS 1993]CDK25051.1 unnamed protein product [Kuraishia capsulata CBS 1993]